MIEPKVWGKLKILNLIQLMIKKMFSGVLPKTYYLPYF